MRVLAFLLLATAACAQTTFPAWVFQKKTSASSASVPVVISGQNNKVFGLDGSGNLALLTNGSGSSTLAGLSDVAITGIANEDLLRYDTNESKWLNISSETLLGAPVLALRELADGVGALTNDGAGVLSWVGYQEADATLAALAALDGTTGFLKQTGADTFTRSGVTATDIVVNPFEVAGKALVSTGGGSGAAAFGNVSLAYTTGTLDGSSRVTFGANEIDGGGNAGRILKRTHQNGTASVGWGFLHPEDVAASGSALQYLRRNADNTALEWATPIGGTPGGSGSEIQYRSGASTFGAVTGSSTANGGITLAPSSGSALTLTGVANAATASLSSSMTGAGATRSMLTISDNWTAATGGTGVPRLLSLEVTHTGGSVNWSSTGIFRVVVNSSELLRVDHNASFSWATEGTYVDCDANKLQLGSAWGLNFAGDAWLYRDAANVMAHRNGTNAQAVRVYETDSGNNDEYVEISAASGTNYIKPAATGTGTASKLDHYVTSSVFITSGAGSPESAVTAPVGSLFIRTDGGASTTLYVKESGSGNTGWVAK